MIIYYKSQIKEDNEWCDDLTFMPLAVQQKEAQSLIECMELGDDVRVIRIEKFEAMNNYSGRILWLTMITDGQWAGEPVPVDSDFDGGECYG